MKNILLTLILLFPCLVTAQNNNQHQIDSLRQVISMQHGIDKLNSYHLLGSYLFDAGSLEEMKAFFEENENVIVQEQAKEKDPALKDEYTLQRASLKLNLAYVMFNFGDFDDVVKQARNTMEYCRENEQWTQYYKNYLLLLDALTASMKYEEYRQEAKNMYEVAKERNDKVGMVYSVFSLAEISMKQYRFAVAEKYYKECIDIAATVDFGNVCYPLTDAYIDIFQVLIWQKKYDEAFLAIPQTEAAVQRLEEIERQRGYASFGKRITLYSFYAEYYLKIKDYRNAERYCTLGEELSRSIEAVETIDYSHLMTIRAQILEARGQYAEALKLAEQSYLLSLDIENFPMGLNDILSIKARLLIRLGKIEEGIALHDSIQTRTINILNTEFNAQLDEIRTRYEVDKLEHKNNIITIEKERHRTNFLFALGGCILLTITLGIWIYYSHTIIRNNRELVRKNREWAGIETVEKQAEPETPAPETVPDETEKLLMAEIEKQIEAGFYKDPNLTLDMLAEKIESNPTYVSKAISRCTGKTFKTYINEYRIKEAIRLLSGANSAGIAVETLAFDCGFNDRTNFFRVFKKITGLSPTDFKNNALKK